MFNLAENPKVVLAGQQVAFTFPPDLSLTGVRLPAHAHHCSLIAQQVTQQPPSGNVTPVADVFIQAT